MPPGIDEVVLAERLTRIEEGQKNLASRVEEGFGRLHSDLARHLKAQVEDEERIRALEQEQAKHCEALANHATALGEQKDDMGNLRNRINSWSGVNTIIGGVASLIALFKP